MEKFTSLSGVAAPLLLTNISTDLLAPSHFPGKQPEEAMRMALRDKLFANLRYAPDGTIRPGFVLDQPRYRDARFLLAGTNFGCGSSRETAVWALQEAGFRCVIAPAFGDIFHDNAFQNGLLPLKLPMEDIERLAAALDRSNAAELTIDLEHREIRVPGLEPVAFDMPEERRLPMLEGLDQLGLMLQYQDDMALFEQADAEARPWAAVSVP